MIYLDFANGKIELKSPPDMQIINICQQFPIRRWNKKKGVWEFPFTIESYEFLISKLAYFSVDISAKLNKEYKREKAEILKLKIIKESSDMKLDSKLSNKLYNFQRVGVGFLLLSSRALLADEMGTGKTLQALCLCEEVKAEKILIVCPNSLKWTWANEIEKWLKSKDHEVYQTKVLNLNKRFSIINYEAVWREKNENIFKVEWDVLILDEAHRIKNRKTRQTKAIKKIKANRVLELTGTPVLNRPDELWSLLNQLYPKKYTSYWRFFEQYVDYWMNDFGGSTPMPIKVIRGPKNLHQLKRELEPIMIRREKKDILLDLPDKTYQNIFVELDKKQRKIYEEMKEDFIVKLKENKEIKAPTIIAQIVRLKQIAVHTSLVLPEYDKTLPGIKLEVLFELIESLNKKVVIFSQFAKAINIIENKLIKKGLKFAKITGEVNPKQRAEEINKFQTDDNCKIFIGTIQAGGQGITLTAADTVIFLDKLWTPAYNEQAEDRLHRIGQKKNVTVVNLIAKNTIEDTIERILENKKMTINEILGNRKTIIKIL